MRAITIVIGLLIVVIQSTSQTVLKQKSGNPVLPGWYADPEGAVFGNSYWIFPTYSDVYEKQVFFDAFSSPDLVHWTKHDKVLDSQRVKWAKKAMWAPSVVKKGSRYYFFFSANDVHKGELGGIGVAVANKPEGPFNDLLGKPLINDIVNGAQPIDQFIFKDKDEQYYIIYGGWSKCNIARLKKDFTGLVPFEDGSLFKELTPKGYVEGPFMFIRKNKYYFMWSEGGWGGANYRVAYAIADSPFGPFQRIGTILQQDTLVGTGAGHHSIMQVPKQDKWYIVYHRRPLGEKAANHRVTCIDELFFDSQGNIVPVKITKEGVERRVLK